MRASPYRQALASVFLARNLATSNPAAACVGCHHGHIDRFLVEEMYSKALAMKVKKKKNQIGQQTGGSIEPSNLYMWCTRLRGREASLEEKKVPRAGIEPEAAAPAWMSVAQQSSRRCRLGSISCHFLLFLSSLLLFFLSSLPKPIIVHSKRNSAG